jgi:hypothetical protein
VETALIQPVALPNLPDTCENLLDGQTPLVQPNRAPSRVPKRRLSAYERSSLDWYVEPSWVVEQLVDAVDFDPSLVIWDPACGSGTIPRVFRQWGFGTIESDIADRGFGDRLDFFSTSAQLSVSVHDDLAIVTNPPYGYERGIAERFIRRALDLDPVIAAFLLPIGFLTSRTRYNLFSEHPPAEVLICSQRPSMPPGDAISHFGKRAFKDGTADYCWIVWYRMSDGCTRMRWLKPVEAA